MGRVISIINQKGGSGKTTTTTNMAACLNELGYKVLVIDLDNQCNTTFNLGCIDYKDRKISIISLLKCIFDKKEIPFKSEYIYNTASGIDLIPSCSKIEYKILSDLAATNAGGIFLLKKFLKKEDLSSDYDFIIIDNNGYLGTMYQNSIIASSDLIIPASADTFDLQGMFELINSIQDIINDGDVCYNQINLDGILITDDEERTQVSKNIKSILEETFRNINFYKTTIPHSQDIRKSQLLGEVLCSTNVKSKAKDAYFEFTKEFLKNVNK